MSILHSFCSRPIYRAAIAALAILIHIPSTALAANEHLAPQSDFQQKSRVQRLHDWWHSQDIAKARELQVLLAQLHIYSARPDDISGFLSACRILRRLKDPASVQPLVEILNHFRPGGPLEGRLTPKTRDQLVQALFETLNEIDSFAPVRAALAKLDDNPYWQDKNLTPQEKENVEYRVGQIWYLKPYIKFLGFPKIIGGQITYFPREISDLSPDYNHHLAEEMVYLCWVIFSEKEWKQSLLAVLLSPDAVRYFGGHSNVSRGLTHFDTWMKPGFEEWTMRAWDSSNDRYLSAETLTHLLKTTVATFREAIGDAAVREVLEQSLNDVVLPRMEKKSNDAEEKMMFYALSYLYLADTQLGGHVLRMKPRLQAFLRRRDRGLLHWLGIKKTPVLLAEATTWSDARDEVAAVQRKKSIARAYLGGQELDQTFAQLWLKEAMAAPDSMRQWHQVLAEMPAKTIGLLIMKMEKDFYYGIRMYAPLLEALLENYGKKDSSRLGYYHEVAANPGVAQGRFGYKAMVAPYSLMRKMDGVEPDALYLAIFLSMDERDYLRGRDKWRDYDEEFLHYARGRHAKHSLSYIRFYVRDGVLTIVELQSDVYRHFKNLPDGLKMKEHYAWWKKALLREIEHYARAKGITRIRWVNEDYIHKRWKNISSALTVALYKRLPVSAGYDPVEQHGMFEGVPFDRIYEKVLEGMPNAAEAVVAVSL